MEVYNVTHGVDIDGMSSAALLVHYYGLPLNNILFINYDESRFPDTMKQIGKLHARNGLFVFSDFNANDSLAPSIVKLFRSLRDMGNRIIWLDHHPWGDATLRAISPYCDLIIAGENRYRCGAELVYKVLCKGDAFGDRLARFAHVSDFALKGDSAAQDALIKKYSLAITYFNLGGFRRCDAHLRRLVAHLAKGEFRNSSVDSAYKGYIAIMKKSLDRLMRTSLKTDAGRHSIAIGFSRSLNGNTGCGALMGRFSADIALSVDTTPGKMSGSLRSTGGVDCSVLARALGGGGHPPASGFNIRKGSYDFSRARERARFVEDVRSLSKKLYGR